jgi:hypothetical protein
MGGGKKGKIDDRCTQFEDGARDLQDARPSVEAFLRLSLSQGKPDEQNDSHVMAFVCPDLFRGLRFANWLQ